MNPEIKQKWLEALRSGEYEQARGWLHPMSGGFCCLGVLCDLHAKETGGKWEPATACNSITDNAVMVYMGSTAILPTQVKEWACIDGETAMEAREYSNMTSDLVHLNDNGKDFNHIADVIERRF